MSTGPARASHFNLIPLQVYGVNTATHEIVFINNIMQEITGDLTGQKCHQALHYSETSCLFCPIPKVVDEYGRPNGNRHDTEYFNEVEDCWYQLKSNALEWDNDSVIVQSVRVDITELKEAQSQLAEAHATMAIQNKRLAKSAVTDRLTGLANRLMLDRAMLSEIAKSNQTQSPLSIIILDIDHFKSVNDTYGHQRGDDVLKTFSQIIQQNARGADTVGRWGGEEFMVILPNASLQTATEFAELFRISVEEHEFDTVGHKTASFGVAQYNMGEEAQSLIKRADTALYNAKETGRNKVVSLSS